MPHETQTSAEFQPGTTIAELRRRYGPHFAPGYGDQDTLGELLGRASFNTLDDYLSQHHLHDASVQQLEEGSIARHDTL